MTSCILKEKKDTQLSICHYFGVRQRPSKPLQTTVPKKRKLEQLYLDLGQRDFGKPVLCPTCGMMYVPGVEEDGMAHAQMCHAFQHGVRLTPTPAMRLVNKISPDECILEIRQTDSRNLRNKLAAVLDVVKRELSFVTSQDDSLLTPQQTAYLYIVRNRVVGLVVAETIEEAFTVHPSERREAVMGVFLLWVHSKFRRKGFASCLVTAARKHRVFGMVVPVQKTAFSSPTQSGLEFAKQYANGPVLVYNCMSLESK
ncbi:N-acetyltransferase [Fistulifera solaris]|uniref:N-acetyltransferase n=1 Tax=Fistulifera solaris TaxID=1519565 RepID=A0A1Z5J6J4_FISSO|nr:N-acetyltransferase [Fistulifera solaris]|eukprot:GAX09391.1 N-acetyltransferase [Fistulifera solaris]